MNLNTTCKCNCQFIDLPNGDIISKSEILSIQRLTADPKYNVPPRISIKFKINKEPIIIRCKSVKDQDKMMVHFFQSLI